MWVGQVEWVDEEKISHFNLISQLTVVFHPLLLANDDAISALAKVSRSEI